MERTRSMLYKLISYNLHFLINFIYRDEVIIVRSQWLVDSIARKRLLSVSGYLLLSSQPNLLVSFYLNSHHLHLIIRYTQSSIQVLQQLVIISKFFNIFFLVLIDWVHKRKPDEHLIVCYIVLFYADFQERLRFM